LVQLVFYPSQRLMCKKMCKRMLGLGPFAHRRWRTKVRLPIEVRRVWRLARTARNATQRLVTGTLGIPGSSFSRAVISTTRNGPVPAGRLTSSVVERSRKKSAADQIRRVELLEDSPLDAPQGRGGRGITARIYSQICQNPTIYPRPGAPRRGKMPPRAV
jgi:hypothetical protein